MRMTGTTASQAAAAATAARRCLLRSSSTTSKTCATMTRARFLQRALYSPGMTISNSSYSRSSSSYAATATAAMNTCMGTIPARVGVEGERGRRGRWRSGVASDRGWMSTVAAVALAAAVGVGGLERRDAAKNCGIVGVVSTTETGGTVDAREFLLEV